MALTDDDINDFVRIYREEFGEILSFADAKRRAEEVMMLLAIFFIDPEVRTDIQEKGDDPFIGNLR
jgi:hypothetical protein